MDFNTKRKHMNKITVAVLTLLLSTTVYASRPAPQPQKQGQGQAQGQSQSSRSSSSSRSTSQAQAKSEGSVAGAYAGGSQSQSGDTSSDSEIYIEGDTDSASSAASIFTAACQQGASGQGAAGGGALVMSDPLCDLYKVAEAEYNAFVRCNEQLGVVCTVEERDSHYGNYREAMSDANTLVQSTQYTSWLSRFFGGLVIPAGVIYLIFLI
jgi:hypothetical protein